MSEVTPEQRAAFKLEQVRIAGSLMCGHGPLLDRALAALEALDPFAGRDECYACHAVRSAGHEHECPHVVLLGDLI